MYPYRTVPSWVRPIGSSSCPRDFAYFGQSSFWVLSFVQKLSARSDDSALRAASMISQLGSTAFFMVKISIVYWAAHGTPMYTILGCHTIVSWRSFSSRSLSKRLGVSPRILVSSPVRNDPDIAPVSLGSSWTSPKWKKSSWTELRPKKEWSDDVRWDSSILFSVYLRSFRIWFQLCSQGRACGASQLAKHTEGAELRTKSRNSIDSCRIRHSGRNSWLWFGIPVIFPKSNIQVVHYTICSGWLL